MSIYDDILRDRSKLRRSTEAGGAWTMNEPTYEEKAHAALDKLASDAPLTQADRNKLCDDVHCYIYDLELQLRILG
jgi:hypothetical protein